MLTLVPTPIGNLQDFSQRAIDALLEAELIFCEDTRVTKKLLSLLSEKNNLTFNCTEFKSFHSHNEKHVLSQLNFDDFNKPIVYVSDAGMPCVSDPGATLVDYCIKNSIEYDVIPGANAVLTAFAMSGFEETQFTFFGFIDHKGKSRADQLSSIMQSNILPILYESPHRLLKTLEEISKIDPNRILFLAKEITKKFQNSYKDSAQNLYEKLKKETIKGEWVIIIEPIEFVGSAITLEDLESLEIPPKIKAKLIAKLKGVKTKEVYQELLAKI